MFILKNPAALTDINHRINESAVTLHRQGLHIQPGFCQRYATDKENEAAFICLA